MQIPFKLPPWISALLLAFAAMSCAEELEATKPNVILIISDDQGFPDLGCIGSKPIITPNLDRLAAEGVRATSFYVTWPACTPSRGSVLTGRFPQRNGLYEMVRNDKVDQGHHYSLEEYATSPEMTLGLDPRELTIGDLLTRAGWRCGVIGKWDMGQARTFLPLQRGFEFFYGHGNNGIDYYTHERYGIPSMFRANERTQEDRGAYATDVFKREALQFIRERRDKPFFLYLAFNAPHGASSFGSDPAKPQSKEGVQVPEKYAALYRGKVKDERLARYYGAVTCMDEAIGELMSELKLLGIEKNTLVVFLSDNGGSGNGGNAPLKGGKSTLWEGGLRVPFIARWPEKLPAGRMTHGLLTSLEILPTILAATGVKPPADVKMDGFDMLPALRGEKESPRDEMFWEHRGSSAVRIGNWKWLDSEKGAPYSGLFDLRNDSGEKADLSLEKPDVVKLMKSRLEAWRKEMDASEARGPFRKP